MSFVTVVQMDGLAVEQGMFPWVERQAQKKSAWREMVEAFEVHGYLLPRAHIPVVLDVSRQRVHELISEGRIATVMVQGREFVPLSSLETFLVDERKTGRPVKELTLGESYARHLAPAWQNLKNSLKKRA